MTYINIESIAKSLGKAKHTNSGWSCLCPAHDDHNPSLSLSWDERTQKLLAKCWTGCSFDLIIDALKSRGLLPDRESPQKPCFIPKVSVDKGKEKERAIIQLWEESIPAQGTLSEVYLKARGYEGTIPPTIRHHPRLYHTPSRTYHPAMVSEITWWPDDTICGVQRTYLHTNGVEKASVKPNKMMLGDVKGGAVRLSPAGSSLVLTEGIETALSVFLATDLPTWATLSTSGMVNIVVPPLSLTPNIMIAADYDAPGIQAAKTLAQRLIDKGYKVKILCPPEEDMDFNDLLRRKA